MLKKGILFFFLTILAISLTLFLKAIFVSKPKLPPKVGLAFVSETHLNSFAQNLALSIQFKTISPQNEKERDVKEFIKFQDFLKKTFPLVHKNLVLRKINELSLLYEWRGKNANRSAVLMGHYDVVPANPSEWDTPPFSGKIEGDYIYGRGALDDKVTVMGILQAVEILLSQGFQPERTLYLAFGHDEEIGGLKGGLAIAQFLEEKGVRADFVLDEGGALVENMIPGISQVVATIGIAEKGYYSLKLIAFGDGGHSSAPPLETATEKLVKALAHIRENPFPKEMTDVQKAMFSALLPYFPFWQRLVMANLWLFKPLVINQISQGKTGRAMLSTTLTTTILKAGEKENIVPERAEAIVNLRLLPGTSREKAKSYVQKLAKDITIEEMPFSSEPSPISPVAENSEGFSQIHRVLISLNPEIVVTPYLVLGATDSRHYTKISRNIYRFSPVFFQEEDFKRMHGKNERISKSSLNFALKFYTTLLKEL